LPCSDLCGALALDGRNLIDAPLMPSALERCRQPECHDLVCQPGPDDPSANGEHIGVVVLPRHPRRVELVAERRTHAGDFVGRYLLALTAAAHHDAAIGLTAHDGATDPGADRRVVNRILRVRAVIVDIVAEPPQRCDEVLFEREAGVVGADRDPQRMGLYRRPDAFSDDQH
jgi:hypothetical protein